MKRILILLLTLLSFSAFSQKFGVDIARDSIMSVNKYQHTNGNWRLDIIRYNADGSYSMFVQQENTENLIDAILNELIAEAGNTKDEYFITYQNEQKQKEDATVRMVELKDAYDRLIRNRNKLITEYNE